MKKISLIERCCLSGYFLLALTFGLLQASTYWTGAYRYTFRVADNVIMVPLTVASLAVFVYFLWHRLPFLMSPILIGANAVCLTLAMDIVKGLPDAHTQIGLWRSSITLILLLTLFGLIVAVQNLIFLRAMLTGEALGFKRVLILTGLATIFCLVSVPISYITLPAPRQEIGAFLLELQQKLQFEVPSLETISHSLEKNLGFHQDPVHKTKYVYLGGCTVRSSGEDLILCGEEQIVVPAKEAGLLILRNTSSQFDGVLFNESPNDLEVATDTAIVILPSKILVIDPPTSSYYSIQRDASLYKQAKPSNSATIFRSLK